VRQVAPFALAGIVAPLISLGGDAAPNLRSLVAGLVLLGFSMTGMTWSLALQHPRWMQSAWIYLWIVALTLLVLGVGGAGSGATLILFLPALWMSLYSTRLEALAVLAVVVACVISVTLFDGASELTTVDVRRIMAFVTVLALAVWTISTLVSRLATSERDARIANETLTLVATAAQQIRQSSDPRLAACQALLEVSGASAVLIFEPEAGKHLRSTASIGLKLPELRLNLGTLSPAMSAYQNGRAIFVADAIADESIDQVIAEMTHARSVLAQPFGHDGAVRGVIELTWPEPHRTPPGQTSAAVTLLAQEVGWSIERADLMNSLRRSATTDALTGLGNRRVWRDQMPTLTRRSLCVAIADLDHFKAYNDEYGHLAGDALLRELAESWRHRVRPDDLLVRWGGEEFAIGLPDCPIDVATEVLERLRDSVPLGQTVSIGVAQREPDESVESLMGRADLALYKAKSSGRNRICVAEPSRVTAG
jgi:diguanylate cyclase (GGDEF)-like protein